MIQIIKLINGDTIISDLEPTGKYFILTCPMIMGIMPIFDTNGKVHETKLYLKEWMPYSDNVEFKILKSHVLTCAEPDDDIIEIYNKHLEIDPVSMEEHYLNGIDESISQIMDENLNNPNIKDDRDIDDEDEELDDENDNSNDFQ